MTPRRPTRTSRHWLKETAKLNNELINQKLKQNVFERIEKNKHLSTNHGK